jgi:outer membrane murein-binding lipoprotein Lpp/phage tail protein X
MKKIFLAGMILAGALPLLRAQDAEMTERINKLAGQVQDLADGKEAMRKDIDALTKQIADMRDQSGKPNDVYATQDDVKRLTEKLEQIEKERQADKELILQKISELGRTLAAGSTSSRGMATPAPSVGGDSDRAASAPAASPNDKGYEYTISPNDTVSGIVKKYREKNIRVTVDQILKANPGLKPEKLVVGKKIWIPAPQ